MLDVFEKQKRVLGVSEEQKRCHCGKDRMDKGMRIRGRQQGGRRVCSAFRPWLGL